MATTNKKKPSTPKAKNPTGFVLNNRPKLDRREDIESTDPDHDSYSYELEHLWANEHGSIIANAGCSDVFICDPHEIPELIAFLQSCIPGK